MANHIWFVFACDTVMFEPPKESVRFVLTLYASYNLHKAYEPLS